jgi:hypothetical protein
MAAPRGRGSRPTYGRALWTGDITPLQELTPDILDKPVHLFGVEPRARYGFGVQGMNYNLFGDKYLEVPNEPDALVVNYYLKADSATPPRVSIMEPGGRSLRDVQGPGRAGLNRVNLSLGGGGRGRGGGGAGPLPVGNYVVSLMVGDVVQTTPARVRERIW